MNPLFDKHTSASRSWVLKTILLLAFLILFARLSELTIIKGAYYRSLAEDNRIRRVTISAPRGQIRARGGEILAGNTEVKKIVTFDPKEGYQKKKAEGENNQDEIISEWDRNYPYGTESAHLVGYVSEVNADEVGKANPDCLDKGTRQATSLVGRFGLESQYECSLEGNDGEELVEVDIAGKKIRSVGRREPIAGNDLLTTIDAGLQEHLSKAMTGISGAAIATDGKGQVLAMYSAPSFDPTNIEGFLSDPKLPLFNRTISGAYQPGSIFKLVTATAALESGKITRDYQYDDTGSIKVNDFSYSNWYFTQYGKTEGNLNVVTALARSTDTFFYKVGELMGPTTLADWAEKFGVGKKLSIDLPGETQGLLGTPEWKQTTKGERWFLGNTYHMSIGQGDLSVTPLQANILTSVIANGGSFCEPHINRGMKDNCVKLPISEDTINIVKEGMIKACATGGTAFPFFDFTPSVACKTGTAETGEKDTTHAWFTVFGPVPNPDIVLTILVEKGGEGSIVAAPRARQILNYWFNEREQHN